MPRTSRELRDVVFVDGVRTPFGKAGPKGMYYETRADDLVVKCIRELLRRNPTLPPDRVDEVAVAATTQIGDQGLTIGRTAALARRPAEIRPRLRHRPDVRRRHDRSDDNGSGHRVRCVRHRHRCGGRAHGPPSDGRGCRPEPPVPRGKARRPVRTRHGPDGGEPARPVSPSHQGASRRIRRGKSSQAGEGVRRRQGAAGPGTRRHPQR